jgi:hypothetical protein
MMDASHQGGGGGGGDYSGQRVANLISGSVPVLHRYCIGGYIGYASAIYRRLYQCYIGVVILTHKRTEGRAPVWGSEFI